MSSPEVARVYVGSFWQEPLHTMDNAELFEAEEKDLMRDLAILPRQSAVRKINEVGSVSFTVLSYWYVHWTMNDSHAYVLVCHYFYSW